MRHLNNSHNYIPNIVKRFTRLKVKFQFRIYWRHRPHKVNDVNNASKMVYALFQLCCLSTSLCHTIRLFNLTNCSLEQIVFYQTFRFSPVFSRIIAIYLRVKIKCSLQWQTFAYTKKKHINYNLHLRTNWI